MRIRVVSIVLLAGIVAVAAGAEDEADPAALVAAGGRALGADEIEEAERLFGEAAERAPGLAAAWLGLAEVREAQGRFQDGLGLARRAQRLAPEWAAAYGVAARLLARLGAEQAALDELGRARELGLLRPGDELLAALLLRALGRVDEAIGSLEQALEAGLDASSLRRELAMLLLAAGRPADALEAADAALRAHPDEAGLALAKGLALAALPDRRQEAPPWLERALAGGVESAERVHLELGSVLLDGGSVEAALAHLETAAAGLPETPEAWYRLARARQAGGDAEGARAAMARFQELSGRLDTADHDSRKLGTELNEAQSLALANRLPEALDKLRQVLARAPDEPRALALEAKVLLSMGRAQEALASLGRARQAAPANVEYAFLEGVFLTDMGRPDEAEAALVLAVDLDPGLAEGWERLGRLALSAGRAQQAVERFARALEAGADNPGLLLFYAEALERAGRPEESRRQMEAYRRAREDP